MKQLADVEWDEEQAQKVFGHLDLHCDQEQVYELFVPPDLPCDHLP